ncbi:MAG: hypothetical protein ABH827_01780 [bacterium]
MKSSYLAKLLTCTVFTIALSGTYFEAEINTNQAISTDFAYFANNNDLIADALKNINKHRTGRTLKALCTYDLKTAGITGMTPKKMSTKIYYSDYHKKPDLIVQDLQPGLATDKTVEILYNTTNKKVVNFTVKDASGRVIKDQEIRVPAHCSL